MTSHQQFPETRSNQARYDIQRVQERKGSRYLYFLLEGSKKREDQTNKLCHQLQAVYQISGPRQKFIAHAIINYLKLVLLNHSYLRWLLYVRYSDYLGRLSDNLTCTLLPQINSRCFDAFYQLFINCKSRGARKCRSKEGPSWLG